MPYIDDDQLPEVTDEAFMDLLSTARSYTILVLKAGPNFVPAEGRSADDGRIILEHAKRNYSLVLAGLLPIVCPVADGSDVTGLGIFDATPEEVDRIMAGDPGVKKGVFTYEIHPTRSFPGSALPAGPVT